MQPQPNKIVYKEVREREKEREREIPSKAKNATHKKQVNDKA